MRAVRTANRGKIRGDSRTAKSSRSSQRKMTDKIVVLISHLLVEIRGIKVNIKNERFLVDFFLFIANFI